MRPISCAAAALILPLLAACSTVGDLGRSTHVEPAQVAYTQGQPHYAQPALAISPQEKDMHARLFRFENLESTDNWVAKVMRSARIDSRVDLSESDYFDWLRNAYAGSTEAAYGRIANDVAMDVMTLPQVFQSICDVNRIDQQRQIAADRLPATPPETILAQTARRAENDAKIASFTTVLDFRYNSYSFALEQMLIHAPNAQARTVDAKLSEMANYLDWASARNYCNMPGSGNAPQSRFASSQMKIDLTQG